MKIENGYFKL